VGAAAGVRYPARAVRIAYIVSRFPDPSETFVLREMNAVAARRDTEVELFVLFAPKHPFVHPDAERWIPRAHRSSLAGALGGTLWWLVRRPLTLLHALAEVTVSHARDPARLLRALVTCAVAAGHARTMRRLRIEHVHAHFATYPALAAWLASRLTGAPYSFTAHAHDIFLDQLHLRTLVREAKHVAVISEFNRAFLDPYRSGARTPVSVVHCGVAPASYPFRARIPPADGAVHALCVATLNEIKGHAVLLDALASGGEALERVELALIGSGPLEPALREQARRLGLDGRVRFLGTLEEPRVAAELGRSDLFVLASVAAPSGRMDGIPVALIEALAAGVPVVASRLSGIPELVRDGETGLLAEPGDARDLARAIAAVLEDPHAAAERARAGRRLVEAEFDIERSADAMLELFGTAAGPGRPRAVTTA
jgi:glycosyltransferase involved in cell wall biosynthesis